MIPDLERMLTELRAERAEEPANATVMRVFECQKQHDARGGKDRDEAHHASRSPPPFRHDLHRKRRGHSYCFALKDGGPLCMKTYCVVKSALSGDSRADNRGHAKSLIGPPKHRGVPEGLIAPAL